MDGKAAMTGFSRRELLTAAALVLGEKFAAAEVVSGKLPFRRRRRHCRIRLIRADRSAYGH
jgi:hypothetical protein